MKADCGLPFVEYWVQGFDQKAEIRVVSIIQTQPVIDCSKRRGKCVILQPTSPGFEFGFILRSLSLVLTSAVLKPLVPRESGGREDITFLTLPFQTTTFNLLSHLNFIVFKENSSFSSIDQEDNLCEWTKKASLQYEFYKDKKYVIYEIQCTMKTTMS